MFSLFRYLILRTHTAEIPIPSLEMRTARFRKSGQLPFPHRASKARPETLAQKSVSCGHWPKSATCLFYMGPESWVLFKFLKSCKTSKEDYYFVTCENYKKWNFQCPSVKVVGTSPCSDVTYSLWRPLHCSGRVQSLQQKPRGPHLKCLPFDFLWEKFADSYSSS